MTDYSIPDSDNRRSTGLSFRGVRGESDYPLLLAINRSSRKANNDEMNISLEDIARVLTPSSEMDPTRQVVIASLDGTSETSIGYSRLGWYSSCKETWLYFQISFLMQEYRGRGFWQEMVLENERRLREIAKDHPLISHCYYQAWASDHDEEWKSVLMSTGYQVVRRFNNMLRRLDEIPDYPLPAGFEIRTVEPGHMRQIWEAQKEMNAGLFENVAEDWLEEKYQTWLEDPDHTPQYWQVAWVGDQLAAMVLNRISDKGDEERRQKRGHTEHIYVRPQWRQRGLASALISRSLQVLRDQGMQEAELGVDSENESTAFSLYEKMGYRTFSVDTWLRKTMFSIK